MIFPTLSLSSPVALVLLAQVYSVNGALSSDLLAVADTLSSSQPASDVTAFKNLVQANAASVDQAASSSPNTDATTSTANACKVFKTLFPSKYSDASSSDYVTEVEVPVSETCWLNSTCFFEPQTNFDVALGMKIITTIGSPFATRSGGHSQNEGFSSIENGVLIDMHGLNSTSLSADQKVATVGPGQRWGQLYDWLDQYQLAVVGGRSYDVGVGGLILGVGIPYLSSTYGFACDNVKRFEVVLANSTIVNATATENSDLWKALKGGGPNYGIVTAFDLNTISNQVWYHLAIYNETDYKQVLAALVDVQQKMEGDSDAGILFSGTAGIMLVGLIYSHHTPRPAVFAAFDNLTPLSEPAPETNGTIPLLAAAVSGMSSAKVRFYSIAVSYETDLAVYDDSYAVFLPREHYGQVNDTLEYGIQAITAAAVQAGVDRGGNWLGMKAVSTNWFHVVATWQSAATDAAAVKTSEDMAADMTSIAQKAGKYLDFEFANDAAATQSPLRSYGVDNLNKMKAVAAAYDPAEVFQKLQHSGFKLSVA